MKVHETPLAGLVRIEPRVFVDDRGFFFETWNAQEFAAAGIAVPFVQDNHSRSRRGVLRGIHFQNPRPQGKLVRVVLGEVFDVAVDLRRGSPTFGAWYGTVLSEANRQMLWVPPGFGHGFYTLSEYADLAYKCTAPYDPTADRSILWNDRDLAIDWPIGADDAPKLSAKDAQAPSFAEAVVYAEG